MEVAHICGGYAVAKLQSGNPDQQVGEGDTGAPCRALAVDLSGTQSDWKGHILTCCTPRNFAQYLPCIAAVALCRDEDAGVEYQSLSIDTSVAFRVVILRFLGMQLKGAGLLF
jgi:hypothetical protein